MYFSVQTPRSSESSCQTVLHQQALLSHSEEKPKRENDSQLVVFKSGVMAAKQAGWLASVASPPKAPVTEAITSNGDRETTQTVCWNPAERASRFHAADLISF